MALGSASGKVILFGEHAVVYGRPAIATPVKEVRAYAEVQPWTEGKGILVEAQDLGRRWVMGEEVPDDEARPLEVTIRNSLRHLGIGDAPPLSICIHSTIPIARGLGSGAAVSIAIIRALAAHFERPLGAEELSRLAFETERLYHGTPSGIDNTVIAYGRPLYFVPGQPPEAFRIAKSFLVAIADSGVVSLTKEAVAEVRRRWERERAAYGVLFDQMGDIARSARQVMGEGDLRELGELMDQNHRLLGEIRVSSPELEVLRGAAKEAGALGAKLSGAGKGGNLIALLLPELQGEVREALLGAGAVQVIFTEVRKEG